VAAILDFSIMTKYCRGFFNNDKNIVEDFSMKIPAKFDFKWFILSREKYDRI
jgi:hypothetical protein